MSEKTLKFNNIKINKKEFHKSKQAIDLDSVITDKIIVSDKFRHRFRFILSQMNGYIKYFENGGKNMSLLIKNNEVWERYEGIWNAIKNKLNIKFYS